MKIYSVARTGQEKKQSIYVTYLEILDSNDQGTDKFIEVVSNTPNVFLPLERYTICVPD